MTDDLTGGLDLLGDWLDAKGYGEEAGLCTKAMDTINRQSARIAMLEAALKPFAEHVGCTEPFGNHFLVRKAELLAARAALEGKDD